MFGKNKNYQEKEIVECGECGCLIYKHSAQAIETRDIFREKSHIYYCRAHCKPYNRVLSFAVGGDLYFKEMIVDEKGYPIGYEKIQDKKAVEKPIERQKINEKTCVKCFVTKPYAKFYTNATAKDGRQSYCRACAKRAAREWKKNNHPKADIVTNIKPL